MVKVNVTDNPVKVSVKPINTVCKVMFAEKGKDGKDGKDGKSGFSPVVDVDEIEGGTRITVTDGNGSKTVDIMDGQDGDKGDPFTYEDFTAEQLEGLKPKAIALPSGIDFNTVLTPNLYIGAVTLGDGTNSNYTNSPNVRKTSFKLVVQPEGNKEQLLQRLTLCSKGDSRTWERHYHSGSWGEWTCVYSEGNTLLASPNWVMSAAQTVTLSEPISKQPTGIVLVFSRYENGAVDDNFHTFFISKKEVSLFPGCGHSFSLFRGAGNVFNGASIKYLYIDDTTIRGHAANDDTSGTGSCGVSYNNSIFVLRRVIGV